jgi:hypothetical protein
MGVITYYRYSDGAQTVIRITPPHRAAMNSPVEHPSICRILQASSSPDLVPG